MFSACLSASTVVTSLACSSARSYVASLHRCFLLPHCSTEWQVPCLPVSLSVWLGRGTVESVRGWRARAPREQMTQQHGYRVTAAWPRWGVQRCCGRTRKGGPGRIRKGFLGKVVVELDVSRQAVGILKQKKRGGCRLGYDGLESRRVRTQHVPRMVSRLVLLEQSLRGW